MEILSSRESYFLTTRFSRVLKTGLVFAGLLACGVAVLSVVGDRQQTEHQIRQANRDVAASLRLQTDVILDQVYYSLIGIANDARVAPSADAFLAQGAHTSLRTAMGYDPISKFLFVRHGRGLATFGNDGQLTPILDDWARNLDAMPLGREPLLLPPVRVGAAAEYYVPMLIAQTPAQGPALIVGAMVPVAKLREYGVGSSAVGSGGFGLSLLDGRVLMRSSHESSLIGTRPPGVAVVARLAAERRKGDFEAPSFQDQLVSGAFERSQRYPYFAAAGQEVREYLVPWRDRSIAKAFVLAAVLVLAAFGARTLARSIGALATSESMYRRLFEDVAEAVIFYTPAGEVRGMNPAALKLVNAKDEQEVRGRSLFEFFPRTIDPQTGQLSDIFPQRLARVLAGERITHEHTAVTATTGERFDGVVRMSSFEMNGETLILSVARDLSEERRLARQQEQLANYDALTGLPNRHHLLRTVAKRIEALPGEPLAMILVNLTQFKAVNESFGHRAGDSALTLLASRLERLLQPGHWTLARLGGADLAAVSASGVTGLEVERARDLVLETVGQPIEIDGTAIELDAKLGIASYPEDGLDVNELLRCADLASARAKADARPYAHYSKEFDRVTGRDLALRAELRTAIREGQLRLFYQPKLRLDSGELAGVEALLRWQHPQRGWVSPAEFVPLAESSELIHPLSRWVMGAASEQIAAWQARGLRIKVAVNISAHNVQDADFMEYVMDLLQRRGVAPELLELELTEGALARNTEIVLRRLQDLREAGLGLSLDDFGTGYSSLAYVSQFPFTSIKIDRTFVAALRSSARDRQVAESTISLGHKLGLETIAEGVEDEATAQALREMKCAVAQGYLFARPMPVGDLEAWLRQREQRMAMPHYPV